MIHAAWVRLTTLARCTALLLAAAPASAGIFAAPAGDCYNDSAPALANSRELPSASPQTLSCSDPDPLNDPQPACIDNWGLDYIAPPDADHLYPFANDGSTVHVYVLDTGIQAAHREFQNASGASRVYGGVDARMDPVDDSATADTSDCLGHGTHVAAIIGGRTYGVAKDAILHPVRTLGCTAVSGDAARLNTIRALKWLALHAQLPAVINWSGGNDPSWLEDTELQEAVQSVLNKGIVLVQSAGNESRGYDPANPALLLDACDSSFGGLFPSVIVAGGMDYNSGRWTRRPASDPDDKKQCGCSRSGASCRVDNNCGAQGGRCRTDCGSNGGSCVDIWAPAAHVISAKWSGNDLACRLSGTSMAAPHVTGAVALYLQDNPTASPAQVERALRSRGTWGVLQSDDGDPNYIGDHSDNVVLYADTRSMGNDLPPVASFGMECLGRTCSFNAFSSTDDVGIMSYQWSFGDGEEDAGPIVSHVYELEINGSITLRVTLRVTDPYNHTDHLSKLVTVNDDAPPTASFTYSCSGRTCTFDSNGSSDDHGIASRGWRFGDATHASGTIVTHTYPVGGSFTVELTVTDTVGQTASQQSTVAVDLQPPANVLATASSGTVSITWTPTASADGYDVERKVAGAGWEVAQTVMGTAQSSASDAPVSASGVVLYRVVTRAGTSRSAPSNNDIAYAGTFADDPVLSTTPFTTVKSIHIIQLRRAVNGLHEAIGLTPVYAGADLDEAALRGQIVDDSHFTTLLANLNAARTHVLAGLPPAGFRAAPAQGQPIHGMQIEDLRNGVK